MDIFVKMRRTNESGSYQAIGRGPRWWFCGHGFGQVFDTGTPKAEEITLEFSTHKPRGNDRNYYELERKDGIWYLDVPTDGSRSPWGDALDNWLSKKFGRKAVYVVCWIGHYSAA